MSLTRRSALCGGVALTLFSRLRAIQGTAALFEEIPASASGIAWVHDNAMSANRYLPETMGPGVAFLDYAVVVTGKAADIFDARDVPPGDNFFDDRIRPLVADRAADIFVAADVSGYFGVAE